LGKGTSILLLLRRASGATHVAAGFRGKAENGRAERILVVDDDHDVRGIMTTFLAEIGYIVHEAEHGEAALAIQKSVNPQLMIIDFPGPTAPKS